MPEKTEAATTIDKGALIIERVFDAPCELVWRAWTDPEQLMRWWGPRGFTAPAAEIDFRVGGKYLFAMQSSEFNEGRPNWNTGVYREIVPFERIVCTMCFADENGNVVPPAHYGFAGDFPSESLLTLTFEEQDGKTRVNLTHEGLPAGEMRDGTSEGWNESLDKLAASLK